MLAKKIEVHTILDGIRLYGPKEMTFNNETRRLRFGNKSPGQFFFLPVQPQFSNKGRRSRDAKHVLNIVQDSDPNRFEDVNRGLKK